MVKLVEIDDLISNWETELRRGAIQLLVCAVLAEKDLHGMAICDIIHNLTGNVISVPLGTVYPLLRRYISVGIVETYKPKTGDQRKTIYTLNSRGKEFYIEILEIWHRYSVAVSDLLHAKPIN